MPKKLKITSSPVLEPNIGSIEQSIADAIDREIMNIVLEWVEKRTLVPHELRLTANVSLEEHMKLHKIDKPINLKYIPA